MKPKTVVAKTDKYLDGARGLFTPHQRGFARKPVSVSIITPTMQTEVFCRESLCDIDLRTLQTIVALLTASKSPTEGKVITTMYQLAVECGLRGESTTSRTSIKRSLFRLSNSTWNYQTTCSDEDERAEYGAGSLLQFKFENPNQTGALHINIHPRLADVVCSNRSTFNNLQMAEVRQLKTPVERLLHHYLTSILWSGQRGKPITTAKMIERVWGIPSDTLAPDLFRKRSRLVHASLRSLEAMGWVISPKTEGKEGKWHISRPEN